MSGAILTTGKIDYCTPDWILDSVRKFFWRLSGSGTIDVDPCTNWRSIVGAQYNFYKESSTTRGLRRLSKWAKRYKTGKWIETDGTVLANWGYYLNRLTFNGVTVYINPPFGNKAIAQWVNTAFEASQQGCEVVMLIPLTPETKTWKNKILLRADGLCALKKRVSFIGTRSGIPKSLALVYFGKNYLEFETAMRDIGRCFSPKAAFQNQSHIVL